MGCGVDTQLDAQVGTGGGKGVQTNQVAEEAWSGKVALQPRLCLSLAPPLSRRSSVMLVIVSGGGGGVLTR